MSRFKQIKSIPDFAKLEAEIVTYWKKIKVVELLKVARKDAKEKVYYDGPITANNMPHYGHAITWTQKDIIPRFWSMNGYYVSRNMGWDCQGIPVEWEVEKKLNFKNKEDIEAYGIDKFNEHCKKSVFEYRDSIFEYEERLGRWFDEDDMYYTMDKDYIESMWWSLKELYNKGLLYEGHKVVPYSTRAGSVLSSHEVKDGGYKDIEDNFVTVKFKLKSKNHPNTYFLAWTTTPWTIPGNLLLAIGQKIRYVKISVEDENYILAKDCLKSVFNNIQFKIISEISSKDLLGLEYHQPYVNFEEKREEGLFRTILANHVTTEEGTGIVHLAPYGAEDFDVFMEKGVKLFDYLDESAHFNNLIPEYEGMFYQAANAKIIEHLMQKNVLFNSGKIIHRMPMCYRTKTPLIYKPVKSWYLAVTKIKDKMMRENERINWVPNHVKSGNSGQWIKGARDWSLSRQRYWGTPIPIWINDETGELEFIGSFAELKEKSGVEIKDPHRPYVDEVTWKDPKNKGTFRRIKDVVDVWYDSGSVPFAKLHYPFENKENFKKKFPADYVSEGMDQTHLWFYTMHILGVALFDQIPYENVIVNGMLLARNGDKLAKSAKNYPPMDEVLDKYGADILRYFLTTSPIVQGEFARFYEEALADVRKEFFIPLWNSLKYFLIYADLHNFKPTKDIPVSDNLLDQWILVRLREITNSISENLNNYLIMPAARSLEPFVSDLSTWYIRRSRDRIKVGDKEALHVLHYVLGELAKIMAPFLPFISEVLFESLDMREITNLKSVHLTLFPETQGLSSEDTKLLEKMQNTRNIVSTALSIRDREQIRVRQPLSTVYVGDSSDKSFEFAEELIMDEVNVKRVEIYTKESAPTKTSKKAQHEDHVIYLELQITEDLKQEGEAREFVRKIQELRKKAGLNISDSIVVTYDENETDSQMITKFTEEIKAKVLAKELVPGDKYEITPKV